MTDTADGDLATDGVLPSTRQLRSAQRATANAAGGAAAGPKAEAALRSYFLLKVNDHTPFISLGEVRRERSNPWLNLSEQLEHPLP